MSEEKELSRIACGDCILFGNFKGCSDATCSLHVPYYAVMMKERAETLEAENAKLRRCGTCRHWGLQDGEQFVCFHQDEPDAFDCSYEIRSGERIERIEHKACNEPKHTCDKWELQP